MGYIKEPKGIDFVIKSEPLTEKVKAEISEFIRNYKLQKINKKIDTKRSNPKIKLQPV
jgi:translation initiation factor 2 beta subunit (eIF-2beta)/eIF-5